MICYTSGDMKREGKPKMTKVLATLPPALHEALRAEAKAEGIALTEHLRNILRDHVASKAREERREPPGAA